MMSWGMWNCHLLSLVLLLMVPVHCSGDICSANVTPPEVCAPSLKMQRPVGLPSLDCRFEDCSELPVYWDRCQVEQTRADPPAEVLTVFRVSQCTTDYVGPNTFLGLQFSWTINAGNMERDPQRDAVLAIAIMHIDYPRSVSGLRIELTNHIGADQSSDFMTACLPLKGIIKDTDYNVTAQLQIGTGGSGAPIWGQQVAVTIDCGNIEESLKGVCPAPPGVRPTLNQLCDNDGPVVKVTFTGDSPPGLGSARNYSVTVSLYDANTKKIWKEMEIQMEALTVRPVLPSTSFTEVPAGTYGAKFAFNNEYGIPCSNAMYLSSHTITIPENACEPPTTPRPMPTTPTPTTPQMRPAMQNTDETVWMVSAAVGVTLLVLMLLFIALWAIRYWHKHRRRRSNGPPSNPDTSWGERQHLENWIGALPSDNARVPTISEANTELHPPDELDSQLDSLELEDESKPRRNGRKGRGNATIGYGQQTSDESGYFGAMSTVASDTLSYPDDETMILSN